MENSSNECVDECNDCNECNECNEDIKLGSMAILKNKWEDNTCDCEANCIDISKCECVKLNPDEIIIPEQDITISYDYPIKKSFLYTHHTNNPSGFSRKELSEQIMKKYIQIYEEEDEDIKKSGSGRYGIWGHNISNLYLVSIEKGENGIYELGIDS